MPGDSHPPRRRNEFGGFPLGFADAKLGKAAAFCIALAVAGAARADEMAFELAQDGVIVRDGMGGEKLVKIGCTPRSFATVGTKAYALCGESTVVIVDAAPEPRVLERRPLAAKIVSLTVIDGVISARTDSGVKPLDAYEVASPRAPARPAYANLDEYWARRSLVRPPPPPRVHGLEMTFQGTAGVGLDNQAGVFSVFDAAIVYRPDFPFSLAAFGTFGAATGIFDQGDRNFGPRGGDVQVASGEALLGVDTRLVAFSFGAGAAMFERGYDVEPLVVARGRFGPIDEFAFSWHTSFATSGKSLLGILGGDLEFRVTRRFWLGADAEAGNLRFGRFMIDGRWRVSGTGPSGTLDVRAGLGLAYVESSADCLNPTSPTGTLADIECIGTNTDYLGPAISLGIVFRP